MVGSCIYKIEYYHEMYIMEYYSAIKRSELKGNEFFKKCAPLRVKVRLTNKQTEEVKEEKVEE